MKIVSIIDRPVGELVNLQVAGHRYDEELTVLIATEKGGNKGF